MKQPRKKNRYFDLKSQKMLDKMVKERNIRDSTAKGYMSTIKMYTEFNQMQLYELIDEALKEQDAHIPLRETKLKQRLLDYRNYLMNIPGFSQKTAKTYFSKMLTVYRHFECEIPIIPMAQYKPEYVTTYSDLPTIGHLRQALEVSTVELRAIICFQASSGSARLLLAGHKHDPKAICIGQDLDSVSVKMAALNFYIHGVRGSVLHMNSITNEFFGGYKVNQYLGYGLPLPHIELLHSYEDAFHFFGEGLRNRAEEKVVELHPTGKETVQTTLI